MSLRRVSDVFTIIVSGISLIILILVYQAQILKFIQQYSEAVITTGVVLIYAIVLLTGIYFGRRRRIKRNKLRSLALDISRLKWFVTEQRIKQQSSSPDFDRNEFSKRFNDDWMTIQDTLKELDIPFPQGDGPNKISVYQYLDLLLPLSVTGDIEEARLLLHRLRGESVGGLWASLKFWV